MKELKEKKLLKIIKKIQILVLFFLLGQTRNSLAFSADKVSITHQTPYYFIHISYTIPSLKEKRLAHISFHESNASELEQAYLKLVSGAEFYFRQKNKIYFPKIKKTRTPW